MRCLLPIQMGRPASTFRGQSEGSISMPRSDWSMEWTSSTLLVSLGSKAVRGGIPVVFPQFGRPDTAMAQHGFARNSTWRVHDLNSDDTSATVVLTLASSPATLELWPHEFLLLYTVHLTVNGLQCELKAVNNGSAPFKCHTLLHTYLAVPSISEVAVCGFQGLRYSDKTRDGEIDTDEDALLEISGEVDRVYAHSPENSIPDITILDTAHGDSHAPLITVKKWSRLEEPFQKFEDIATDCVLWNPWSEKAAALADMDDDGYLRYVCVEPGTVADWVTVPSGVALTLYQRLQVPN